MMKTIHNTKIIGIDHGYGNMKTANCCFPTGVTAYDHGNCILLDDGEPHRCVQIISRSGIYCNYFRRAVLPSDSELYA